MKRSIIVAVVALLVGVAVAGEAPKAPDMAPGGKWKRNDMARPKPAVVDPGPAPEKPAAVPSDAVVLFDGKDIAAEWEMNDKGQKVAPKWEVKDGYATVKGGSIVSKQKFADAQIHIEWATPAEVKGSSQGRGNSGVYLGGHGEVQVLDSWNNDTYADGQAGALYGKYPPLVNASRKPGEWQSYDIVIHMAKVDEKGAVTMPARLTVMHNGVLVHHAVETGSKAKDFNISLQDHGNPVRYRNIWVRKLKDYDQQ
jgi:hypothetical protein